LEGNHPRTIWGKIGPIPSIGSDEDFKRFLNQSEAITAILDEKKRSPDTILEEEHQRSITSKIVLVVMERKFKIKM
jgi:hypothetical protein